MRKRANACVADFHVVICIYCAEVTQRQCIIKRAPTTLEVEGMFELVLIAERCSRTRTKFDVFVNWQNPWRQFVWVECWWFGLRANVIRRTGLRNCQPAPPLERQKCTLVMQLRCGVHSSRRGSLACLCGMWRFPLIAVLVSGPTPTGWHGSSVAKDAVPRVAAWMTHRVECMLDVWLSTRTSSPFAIFAN